MLNHSHRPFHSLVCLRSQPYPALGGSPMRNLQNLEALKQLGPVSLFSLYKGPHQPESYGGLAHWEHGDLNQSQRSPQEKIRDRLRWLRPSGHYYTDWIHTTHNAKKFERFVERVQPDLILLGELWLYPYLPIALAYRERNPHCKVILDNHNVEGILAQDLNKNSSSSLRETVDFTLNVRSVRLMESRSLVQADQLWVCSETDAATMASVYLQSPQEQRLRQKIQVIPNCVNLDDYARLTPKNSHSRQPQERAAQASPAPQILFLGSLSYEPNEEAAQILIEQIYPKLQQRYPNVQLMMVGRGPKPWMLAAAKDNPNIVVTGQVESVQPYLHSADVMVVPLRQGSGTRLKLLEAFAAKLPVVSTDKAAEGLSVIDGQQLLLRDDVDDMVEAIAQLVASPSLQQQLVASAFQLVKSHYSWGAARDKINAALSELALLDKAVAS